MITTSNFLKHAEQVVEETGLLNPDGDYEGMVGRNVLAMCAVFSSAGHSGGSAGLTQEALNRIFDTYGS